MSTTEEIYQTPESDIGSVSGSKKSTIPCKRLSASSLFKVMFIGMNIGYLILMLGVYAASKFGIYWPEFDLGSISGSALADTFILSFMVSVMQLFTVYPFIWLGMLIYSKLVKTKLTFINY
ncbi:hypothetical protein [Pseudoalteromonas aurantia]|nr:hypothetical protein [Pseudoalteromonas aurantia]